MVTEPSIGVETEGNHIQTTTPSLHVKGAEQDVLSPPPITWMHVSIGICLRSLEISA